MLFESSEAVLDALRAVDTWEFDIREFSALTNGQPLRHLGWHLLEKW